jgi:hypothetical protein
VEDHVVVIASLRKGSEVLASLDTRLSVSGIHLSLRWRSTNLGRMTVIELDCERALAWY